MLGWHAFIYVSSRAFAAVLNFASVAIFARLAGPADYGEYLLIFAWAFIETPKPRTRAALATRTITRFMPFRSSLNRPLILPILPERPAPAHK